MVTTTGVPKTSDQPQHQPSPEGRLTYFQRHESREYGELVEKEIRSDRVAYDLIYQDIALRAAGSTRPLSLIDSGCHHGIYSANYTRIPNLQVYGMDSFEGHIEVAKEKYGGVPNLHFETVPVDAPIRFDRGNGPEKILADITIATFVLSSLEDEEGEKLISKFAETSAPGGEVHILIRDPRSLTPEAVDLFKYYSHRLLTDRAPRHGEIFMNRLRNDAGHELEFPNRVWNPRILASMLEEYGFENVEIIPVTKDYKGDRRVRNLIRASIINYFGPEGLAMPEYQEPTPDRPDRPLYVWVKATMVGTAAGD